MTCDLKIEMMYFVQVGNKLCSVLYQINEYPISEDKISAFS